MVSGQMLTTHGTNWMLVRLLVFIYMHSFLVLLVPKLTMRQFYFPFRIRVLRRGLEVGWMLVYWTHCSVNAASKTTWTHSYSGRSLEAQTALLSLCESLFAPTWTIHLVYGKSNTRKLARSVVCACQERHLQFIEANDIPCDTSKKVACGGNILTHFFSHFTLHIVLSGTNKVRNKK